MSFTAFLFTIIIILVFGFTLLSIINSRTFRIWLITQRDYLHQKEIEKEMQKTRQRSIEEIKNPDRVMEVIMKIKRGEEVKIPLAAFDYIYRNMKNFSIVDKDGRIAIINQEDYFRFKKEALALLENDKTEAIDVKQILSDIERRVAENPIEITKHENGTVVKVDHVSRTAEITKPNGERILIDHKTDTMVSQDLIEKSDQKTGKKEIILKDAKIKKASEENLLLKGKIRKLKGFEGESIIIKENNKDKTKEIEDFDDIGEHRNNYEDESLLLGHKKIILSEKSASLEESATKQESGSLTDLGIRKRISFDATQTQIDKPIKKCSLLSEQQTMPTKRNLLDYRSLESFLSDSISFQNIYDFTKDLILNDLIQADMKRIIDALKASTTNTNFIQRLNDIVSTSYCHQNNSKDEFMNRIALLSTPKQRLGVIYDEKSSCFLVNINYIFLKLSPLLYDESIKLWFDAFYLDQNKSFVNNEVLTKLIAHINTKSSLSLGSKLLMQEKRENTTVNFRTVKIKVYQEVYQGQYLYLFTTSSFCKSLVQEYEAKMENLNLEIDNESPLKGEKITLFTLL
ncbi:MAG TPA: hypothetical protein CFH80_02220 [Sulfurospirillum cavolei]|uniref:Uncharacterized protein n=1 Tax=Sulfurospirillum cavolei TaxID=366522 RepID=A0A2D3WDV8_9BACT|nr:MAG TPA: hypothetical protein CFH80_02220 [Sulfurospirillum cavolei]